MNSRQINFRAGSNFSPNLNPSSSFNPVLHPHNGPTPDMNHYQTNTCANSSSSPDSHAHAYTGYNIGSSPSFSPILHPNSVNVTHGHGVHPENIFHQQGSGARQVTTRLPAAFTYGPSLEQQNQLLQAHVNRLSTALGQANQENKRLRRVIDYQHEVLAARLANQAIPAPTPAVASAPTLSRSPAPVPASVPTPPSAPPSPKVIDLSGESSPAIPEPRTPSPAPRATPRFRKAAPGWMRTQASDGLIGAIYAGPVKKAEPVLTGPCQTGKGQAASKVVKKVKQVKQVKKSRKAVEEEKKAKKAYEEVMREKEREESEKKEEEKRVEAGKSQEEADIEKLWQEYEEGSGNESEVAGKPVEEALPTPQYLAPEEQADDDDSLFGESELVIVEDP